MTDQTSGILATMEEHDLQNAWGPKARRRMAAEKGRERQEEAEKAGEREYRASVLSQPGRGPQPSQYDYGALVTDGQSLAEDEAGGVALPNRYIRPGNIAMAGQDMGSGEKVLNDGLTDEGRAWVDNGLFGIRQSFTHTTDGAPIDVTGQLAKIAFAYAADGRPFEDYRAAVPRGLYGDELMHKAWAVAEKAQLRVNYENLVTNQMLLHMKGAIEAAEDLMIAPPDPEQTIAVEDLHNDADWLLFSRYSHELLEGRPFVGTPEELTEWAVDEMGYFFNSTIYMARAMAALHDATPQEAEAFLQLTDMYENRVEANFDTAMTAGAAMAGDLPSWLVGAGVGKASLSAARRMAGKAVLQWALAGMGAGAAEGALWSGVQETADQVAMVAAERQGEVDPGEIAEAAAVGGGAGAAVGGAIPPALAYGARASKAGGQMLRRWVNESEMNVLGRQVMEGLSGG